MTVKSSNPKPDWDAVEKYIRTLHRRGNPVTPDALVSDARRTKSPLHALFEWDDAKAAHMQRLDHARWILTKVRIDTKTIEGKVIKVRSYFRDSTAEPNEQGYSHTEDIKTDPERSAATLLYYIKASIGNIASMRTMALVHGTLDDVAVCDEVLSLLETMQANCDERVRGDHVVSASRACARG